MDFLTGNSPQIRAVRAAIAKAAPSPRPVLITGPTGSGKELVARALHAGASPLQRPFIEVNCSAIPEGLIESELFGHTRGAFTGAQAAHNGYFAAANGGTLFLDEMGELPAHLQAKLLRVLETGQFRPLGTVESCTFRGRVIAATHVDLRERVRLGAFREDLYWRLGVLEIRMPGLDERRADIPELVERFLERQERSFRFSEDAMSLLAAAPWPGNVRQLRNVVDRAAVFGEQSVMHADELRAFLGEVAAPPASLREVVRTALENPGDRCMEMVERLLIEEALARANGNKTHAARILGVHRKVVERKLKPASPPRRLRLVTPARGA